MKTIVIYHSQTGFTRRYAEWIAEAVGADCVPLGAAGRRDLAAYDAIVFGSWLCAGGVSKLAWFRRRLPGWQGKKLVAFCVGASPSESPGVQAALEKSFPQTERARVQVFYCPGGFCYEKMPAVSRAMMKLFLRSLRARKDKTPEDEAVIRMISSSYDISERKYIEPILECLRA